MDVWAVLVWIISLVSASVWMCSLVSISVLLEHWYWQKISPSHVCLHLFSCLVNPTKDFTWAYIFCGNLVRSFPVNIPSWSKDVPTFISYLYFASCDAALRVVIWSSLVVVSSSLLTMGWHSAESVGLLLNKCEMRLFCNPDGSFVRLQKAIGSILRDSLWVNVWIELTKI